MIVTVHYCYAETDFQTVPEVGFQTHLFSQKRRRPTEFFYHGGQRRWNLQQVFTATDYFKDAEASLEPPQRRLCRGFDKHTRFVISMYWIDAS